MAGNQVLVYRREPAEDLTAALAIPDGVDLDSITADYNEGVLQVRIKKDAKRFRREVKVQSAAAKPSGSSAKT